MALFDCKPEELAKYFVEDPELYNKAIDLLKRLQGQSVFNPEVEESLEETLKFLDKANSISRESDYFVFESTWTWPERSGEANDEGYQVYQSISGKLVEVLTFTNGIPTEREVFDLLKKRGVKKVYTLQIPSNGYLGLEQATIDDDGDVIDRNTIEGHEEYFLKKEGIEVIVLKP